MLAGLIGVGTIEPLPAMAEEMISEEGAAGQIVEEDAIIADNAVTPTVQEFYQDRSYDNGGEYFYLCVMGIGLTKENAVPSLYRNGVKAAEFTGTTVCSDPFNYENAAPDFSALRVAGNEYTMTYRLRKLDRGSLWSFSADEMPEFEVRFPEGTAVSEYCTNNITVENEKPVLFHRYNYKNRSLDIWLRESAGIKNGTSVTVYVFDNTETSYMINNPESIDTNRALCKRTAKVTDNKLVFTNVTDESLMLDAKNGWGGTDWYYFDFGAAGGTQVVENVGIYDVCNRTYDTQRLLYGMPAAGKKSVDVAILLAASLYGNKATVSGAYVVEHADGERKNYPFTLSRNTSPETLALDVPSGFGLYTGTVSNPDGFDAYDPGLDRYECYEIRTLKDYSEPIYLHALDENFYQSYQKADIRNDGMVLVYVESESAGIDYDKAGFSFAKHPSKAESIAYWNDNGYKVEVFDQDHKPVQSGSGVQNIYWDRNNLYFAVSTDLQTIYDTGSSGEEKAYVKVTKNGEIGLLSSQCTVDGKVCKTWYEGDYFSNEQYGQQIRLSDSQAYLVNNSDYAKWEISSNDCFTGLYLRDYKTALPVTVSFFEPGSETAVCSFDVSEQDLSENGNYYFTESDVSKLDPKQIYRISLISPQYGSFWVYSGYFSHRGAARSDSKTDPAVDSKPVPINKCVITLTKSKSYTGSAISLSAEELTVKRNKNDQTPLTAGVDYKVSYESNTDVGTATVYIEGLTKEDGTGLTGKVKKTFRITPAKFEEGDNVQYRITAPEKVEFAKGGAKLPCVIEWTSDAGATWLTLNEGVDYKLSYKNNKTVNTNGLMTVTGLGNYKGSVLKDIQKFEVTVKNLSAVYAFSPDKHYNAAKKGTYYQSAPVIYDTDGRKLAAKKDYTVVKYVRENGESLDKTSTASQGEIFYAVVEGKGAYEGTINVPYRAAASVLNISKAKVGKIPSQHYTGAAIDLKENGAFPQITLNNDEVKESETDGYRILGYVNNITKGTAAVIIQGMGKYCGIRLITFKIIT